MTNIRNRNRGAINKSNGKKGDEVQEDIIVLEADM
jgi:hypothetical protein